MIVAKKRKPGAGRPKSSTPMLQMIASFRGSEAFAAWFEGLVDHCRKDAGWSTLPAVAVIKQGLICLAKEKGYGKEAPPR
jgi:hypothetical protein